jgi:transcriptional repressor of cell division inhibition gene dicB
MKTRHVITLFGSVASLAAQLGITDKAIYQWGEDVPKLRQYELRERRPDLFRKPKSKIAA